MYSRTTMTNTAHAELIIDDSSVAKLIEQAIRNKETEILINTEGTAMAATDDLKIILRSAALSRLDQQHMTLKIQTKEVTIEVPTGLSLRKVGRYEDVTYVIAPEQSKDMQLILDILEIKLGKIRAMGRLANPMTIVSSYTGIPTELSFRLKDISFPPFPPATSGILAEYADGTQDWITGAPAYDAQNNLNAITVQVNKFGRFDMLKVAMQEKKQYPSYMHGYDDGNFKPSQNITRAELASLLIGIEDWYHTSLTAIKPFKDVPTQHWAFQAIQQVNDMNFMSGDPEGNFMPNQPITRAELAVTAARIFHLELTSETSFADTKTHWAKGAIAAVSNKGYFKGYPDGTFRPNQGVSRAEAVTILNRIFQRPEPESLKSSFADVPTHYWATKSIASATQTFEDYSNGY